MAPTEAVFPGRNGEIGFVTSFGGDFAETTLGGVCADGSRVRQLNGRADELDDPAFSPNGRQLAFSGAPFDVEELRIFRARVAGRRGGRPITNPRSPGADSDPAWAPDGRTLAFGRFRRIGGQTRNTIRILRPGRRLSRPLTSGTDPTWSVRNRIAFVRGSGIHTIKPDSTSLRRVMEGAEPNWSPDGRRLVFTTDRFSSRDLAIIRADGSGFRRLTRTPVDERAPVFSPDGRLIAFVRGGELRVMAARGGPGSHVIFANDLDGLGEDFLGTDWRSLHARRSCR